jgi:hypothetical protein
MAKVQIYGGGLGKDETNALMQLLVEAVVPPADIEVVGAVDAAADGCEQDVFIFLLAPEAVGSCAMDGEIAKVPDGGRRAICVWPQDSTEASPPASAAKFSYSIVSWNPERLRVALADDDVTCFEDPTGEPLPAEDTERLECP